MNNSKIIDVFPREFSKKGKIDIKVIGNYFYSYIDYKCQFFFGEEEKSFITDALYIDNNFIIL